MLRKIIAVISIALVVGSGVIRAAESVPNAVEGSEAGAVNSPARPELAEPGEDLEDEAVPVEPVDTCKLTSAEFFGHTFEELIDLEYPGEGFTGEETLYCEDSEETNPELLADLKAADTNQDGELEQLEFDVWRDDHVQPVSP